MPIIPGIDLYVFILGQHKWAGGYTEIIENNFSKIAQHLGERGAIVAGHDGIKLSRELAHALSKSALNNRIIHNFITKGESLGLSILLVGAHPSQLTEKDLFLLAPIEQIERNFGSLDRFFSELCNFSEYRNTSFLKKYEEKAKDYKDISDFFELKPNMFGIGININTIIKRLQKS